MSSLLIIALILLVAGLALAIAEVLVPSGGLLGIMSALVLGAGVVCAWMYKPAWGVGTLAAVIVLVPVIVVVGFRVLPNTPIGRQMILSTPGPDPEPSPAAAASYAENAIPVAVGSTGRAGSDLRPSGMGIFGDQRVSVVTEGEWIDSDTTIQVVKVEGNRIVVETVS